MPGWAGVFERGRRPEGIHPLASVGGPPEHRDWRVGDVVWAPLVHPTALIHAFCTVDGGVAVPMDDPRGRLRRTTTIGARTFLQARVHVGHNAVIGADCEICAGVVVCGDVWIGDGVKIAGNAWVKPLVEIGDGAIIGGGSVVTKDVPAHEVWAGSPARRQKRSKTHPEYGLCECGCGTATPIAKQSSSRNGWVKGEPVRFVHNHHARRPAEERFWEKVDVPAPDACWEWKAKALPKGYGIFWDGERQVTAHRYSYELHQGPIPEGLWVLHHCDNPPCVNPAHLYAGDNSDNMFDLHERGRARGGQVSPQEAMRRTFEGQERVRPQYDMTPDQWETARMFAYAGGAPSLGEIIEYRKQEWERDHPGPYRPPDGEPHPDWLRGIS